MSFWEFLSIVNLAVLVYIVWPRAAEDEKLEANALSLGFAVLNDTVEKVVKRTGENKQRIAAQADFVDSMGKRLDSALARIRRLESATFEEMVMVNEDGDIGVALGKKQKGDGGGMSD